VLVATNDWVNVNVTSAARGHEFYINKAMVGRFTFFTRIHIRGQHEVALFIELYIPKDAGQLIHKALLSGCSVPREVFSRDTGNRNTSKFTLYGNSLDRLKVVQIFIRGVGITDNRPTRGVIVNAGATVIKALTARDVVLLVSVGAFLIHPKDFTSLLVYIKP
jgi:hypothetical protein